MNNPPSKSARTPRLADLALLAALLLTALAIPAGAQTYSLSNIWNVATGVANLAGGTDGGNRGLAYSAVSNQLFVAYRPGSFAYPIDVFSAVDGSLIGSVNGSAAIKADQIGMADDNVLYGAALDVTLSSSSALVVYSWASWTNSMPYAAYTSTSTDVVTTLLNGKRVGDSMAVTGSGVNTKIIFGVVSGTVEDFILLSTADGINFTPTVLTNAAVPSFGNVFGITFYTNNTFIVRGSGTEYLIQYPTNFATLSSPVLTTVLGTSQLAGGGAFSSLSYSAAGNILGVLTNNAALNSGVLLYSTTNFLPTNIFLTAATYTAASGATDGNGTAAVALGGQGKTNYIFALTSNAGLHAYQINFTSSAVAPAITTQPTAVSGAFPPQSLAVAASGTAPLSYQWYTAPTNTTASATAVSGATNSTYTVTTASTNYYFAIATNSAGSATSAVVLVSLVSSVTNSVVSPLFTIASGNVNYPFLANDDNERGLAFDPITTNLIVTSKSGGANLYLINGITGANVGKMNTGGMITSGTFPIDQVGVADDGVVYSGNLGITASANSFNLTSWPSATTNSTAVSAYTGDPGNGSGDRWGDTLTVRGKGANTQILLGSWSGTNVALLTTSDGVNFSSTLIGVPGVPAAFASRGIAFGTNNTFYAKNYLGDLYVVAFDPTGASNAAVVLDYIAANSTQIPSHMVGVGVDVTNKILGGINLTDQNPDLQLFQLTGNANPPVLFDQSFFPAYNPSANGNDLGVVTLKYPRGYAMDVDIGIVGVIYGVPASTPPAITVPPVGATIYASGASYSLSVTVSGTLPLNFQWQKSSVSNLASAVNISGATSSSYTLSPPTTNDTGWYDVVVTNFGGAVTSAPVLLTVIPAAASTNVTPLWKQAAGSQPYLDSGSYASRGLAYDTNSGTVLIADRVKATITVINASNGSPSSLTINTLGLPQGTFTLDQIRVSDDGVLYGGNLVLPGDGFAFSLVSWTHVSDGGGAVLAQAYSGDPGNGTPERWGDAMAIRGSGANTQILLGGYNGTNVALLTTTDGATFTATTIPVPGAPAGFSAQGIAFGAGNTFWADAGFGYNLRQVSFDPTGATPAAIIQSYNAGTDVPNDLTGLAVDAANNVLVGVCFNDAPNDLQVYELNSGAPVLLAQDFFPMNNVNSQENAASDIKFPYIFSLDVNNGLVAAKYSVPPAIAPTIKLGTSLSTGSLTLSWNSLSGHSYQIQSTTSLKPTSWSNVGSPILATGTTSAYVVTPLTGAGTYYRVFGTN